MEILYTLQIGDKEYFLIKLKEAVFCVLEMDQSFYGLGTAKNIPTIYFNNEGDARNFIDRFKLKN